MDLSRSSFYRYAIGFFTTTPFRPFPVCVYLTHDREASSEPRLSSRRLKPSISLPGTYTQYLFCRLLASFSTPELDDRPDLAYSTFPAFRVRAEKT